MELERPGHHVLVPDELMENPTHWTTGSSPALHRWACRLLWFELHLTSCDPFFVYRMNVRQYRRSRYKTYDLTQKYVSADKRDARRKRMRRLSATLMGYFYVKTIITATLQLLHPTRSAVYSGMVAPETLCDHLMWLIGNPLQPLTDLSFFFYIGITGLTFWYLVVMASYYDKNPLDMPNLRFFLEPEQEIRRLDAEIVRKVDKIVVSNHFHKFNTLQELNYRAKMFKSAHDSSFDWSLFEKQRQVLLDARSKVSRLRPALYSYSYYRKTELFVSRLIVLTNIGLSFWSFTIMLAFLYPSMLGKCQALRLAECGFFEAFTLQERIFCIELILCLYGSSQSYILHQTMFLSLIRSQLKLVNDTKAQLRHCLTLMRLSKTTPEHQLEVSLSTELGTRQEDIEHLLLETLVRVLVSNDELRRGTVSLSEVMATHLFIGFSALALNFLTFELQSSNSNVLRTQLLVFTWISLNVVILFCSYILARVTDLEHLYWSVVAEITKRDLVPRRPSQGVGRSLWHKLAYSARAARPKYCAAPFKFSLSYRRILELNFLVISLLSFFLMR